MVQVHRLAWIVGSIHYVQPLPLEEPLLPILVDLLVVLVVQLDKPWLLGLEGLLEDLHFLRHYGEAREEGVDLINLKPPLTTFPPLLL